MKAFGYTRVSTVDQAENGYSLRAQEDKAQEYYQLLLRQDRYTELEWGGMFVDKGVSARKTLFRTRDQGSALLEVVKPGDHIIFCYLDRAFRQVHDAANQMEEWSNQGIGIHFVDKGLATDNASGKFLVNIYASVAQLESDSRSERTKEGIARRKREGLPANQKIPSGMQLVGSGKNQRLAMDPKLRKIYWYIRYCRRHKGMSFQKIADALEKCLAKAEGRAYINEHHCTLERPWKKGRVQTAWRKIDTLMPSCRPSERRKIWNKVIAA